MTRRNVVKILKWVVSVTILWVLVASFDFSTLTKSILDADIHLLVLAVGIGFTSLCLGVLRWRASLAIQGIHSPFQSLLSSTLVSGFLGFFLPSFGEDAVRGYDLYKFGPKRGIDIAASILFERICGLLAHVTVGGIALALLHERIADRGVVHAAAVLYACIVAALFIVFRENLSIGLVAWLRKAPLLRGIADKVESLSNAFQLYRHDRRAWTGVFGFSLLYQLSGFLYFFVIAKSLGVGVGFSAFVLLLPIVIVLSLVPISIGGLGVKEALFVVLFAQIGVDRESAFLTSAVGSALYMLFVLLGGLVFLLRRGPKQNIEVEGVA